MKLYPIHIETLNNISPSCQTTTALLKKSQITKHHSRIQRAVRELKDAGYLGEGIHTWGKPYQSLSGLHSTHFIERKPRP